MRVALATLLLAACVADPSHVGIDLRFAPDALPAPDGMALTWRLIARWPGGSAEESGAYVPGGTIALPSVPDGSDRTLLVEISSPERVVYWGESAPFDLTAEMSAAPVVLLRSTPQAAAFTILGSASDADAPLHTHNNLVTLALTPLAGKVLHVSTDPTELPRGGEARALSSLTRVGDELWWEGFQLCEAGACPASTTLYAAVTDDSRYASAIYDDAIAYDDSLGWECFEELSGPGACYTLCGDGITAGDEVCDHPTACTSDCTRELGECGDRTRQSFEGCDDGGTVPGDGCDASCQVEPGWDCDGTRASCVRVHRVREGAPSGGDGTTWPNALPTLRAALQLARPGEEIWVAAGVYTPDIGPGATANDADMSFELVDGVAIYGGFTGAEARLAERDPVANETVLDGDLDRNPTIQGTHALHVVRAGAVSPSAILDGFTIRAGYADPGGPSPGGAGLRIGGGSPTIRNCRFTDNFAETGGAVHVEDGNPLLEACTFDANGADHAGGAIYVVYGRLTVSASTFDGNRVFQGQSGDNVGGGAIFVYEATLQLERSRFVGNEATYSRGGAVHVYEGGFGREAEATVLHSLFYDNRARGGGAIALSLGALHVVNSTLSGNCGNWYRNDTTPEPIAECDPSLTFEGALWVPTGKATVANTIVWANRPSEIAAANAPDVEVSYSIVAGGWSGISVSSADPRFVSATDHHLAASSPAIDAGNNGATYLTGALDLDGRRRYAGVLIDLGPYEY
jgi:cysteine-rich repeat protein/predicted outer membrane repeat protein